MTSGALPAALALALAAAPAAAGAPGRWWMDEPVRLVQTNVRETDSTLDASPGLSGWDAQS